LCTTTNFTDQPGHAGYLLNLSFNLCNLGTVLPLPCFVDDSNGHPYQMPLFTPHSRLDLLNEHWRDHMAHPSPLSLKAIFGPNLNRSSTFHPSS
jgi:hypothetical protein